MTMTASQKVTRSVLLKAVTNAASAVGIEVVPQFEVGGRALVGKQGFDTVVWLEETNRWHKVEM